MPFTLADGQPLRFDMTAGDVSDYPGDAAPFSSLRKAERLLGNQGHDTGFLRYSFINIRLDSRSPGRTQCGKLNKHG